LGYNEGIYSIYLCQSKKGYKMSDQNFYEQDFDFIDETQAEAVLPPLIQWHRGDLQNVNEMLKVGCFQLPVERYSLDNQEPVDVLHGTVVIPSYLFKGLHIAILAYRKDWFTGRGKESRPQVSFDPNAKAWSRIQVWAIVKQLDNAQFILTFSRSNAMGIEETIKQFRNVVIGPVSQKVKKNFPLYSFWCPIGPDKPKEFKEQGTYATPPKLFLTPPVSENKLKELFTGKDIVEMAAGIYPLAKKWSKQPLGQREETTVIPDETLPDTGDVQPPPFLPNEETIITDEEFPF